ncbi:MAG: hypothetical protein HC871_06030 [Rhizobiales bacterium]|nr:hypothetical protein [Hyphomicrobiales bacterium]
MRPSTQRHAVALGLAAVLATAAFSLPAVADEVEIRIVNITRGQVFSPVIAWSHKRDFGPLFDFGEAASDQLREIAENGDVVPMEALLAGDGDVLDIAIGTGPIPPGGEETLTLEAAGSARAVSLASMLVNTNDTFFALRGVDVRKGDVEVFAPASMPAPKPTMKTARSSRGLPARRARAMRATPTAPKASCSCRKASMARPVVSPRAISIRPSRTGETLSPISRSGAGSSRRRIARGGSTTVRHRGLDCHQALDLLIDAASRGMVAPWQSAHRTSQRSRRPAGRGSACCRAAG